MEGMKHFRPWRIAEVGCCFGRRSFINVDRMDTYLILSIGTCIIQALCGHQGDGAGAGADIEQIAVGRMYGHGRTKENTVGVHLHCTSLIYDFKLLEPENSHFTKSHKDLQVNHLNNRG
jgi:hypothetical protein